MTKANQPPVFTDAVHRGEGGRKVGDVHQAELTGGAVELVVRAGLEYLSVIDSAGDWPAGVGPLPGEVDHGGRSVNSSNALRPRAGDGRVANPCPQAMSRTDSPVVSGAKRSRHATAVS